MTEHLEQALEKFSCLEEVHISSMPFETKIFEIPKNVGHLHFSKCLFEGNGALFKTHNNLATLYIEDCIFGIKDSSETNLNVTQEIVDGGTKDLPNEKKSIIKQKVIEEKNNFITETRKLEPKIQDEYLDNLVTSIFSGKSLRCVQLKGRYFEESIGTILKAPSFLKSDFYTSGGHLILVASEKSKTHKTQKSMDIKGFPEGVKISLESLPMEKLIKISQEVHEKDTLQKDIQIKLQQALAHLSLQENSAHPTLAIIEERKDDLGGNNPQIPPKKDPSKTEESKDHSSGHFNYYVPPYSGERQEDIDTCYFPDPDNPDVIIQVSEPEQIPLPRKGSQENSQE
jgi:hypothetical protein